MHEIDAATLATARQRLCELPEFAPRAEVWSSIESGLIQRSHSRSRRRSRWLAGCAAAALVAFALLPAALRQSPADDVDRYLQRSHALERQWQSASRTGADPLLRAQLQLIDGELQAAYDRGARDEELLPLWKRRGDALQHLLDSNVTPVQAVVRI